MPGPETLQPSDPSSFGEYSVTGRLGKGGQGIVYLAEDADGEQYAVKVLNDQWSHDSDLRRRFEKEVRAAQKVASFCTAAIIDAQLDNDPPYVVSEFVQGKDLQETIAKGSTQKGSTLQRLAVSTATALVAIHKAGIVHRDFKPGNVLLGPDGPRVIDFGIARMDDGTATMTNSIVGTPSYMAPEQIEGRGVTDKCDIFAWGCVIAFASTGHAPFGADTVPAVVHRVVSAPPELTGMDETLRPIVESCLDKNPDNRPNAQTLLMRLLGHDGPDTSGPSTDDAVKQGEQIAQTGLVTGGQMPFHPQQPPTGPQAGAGYMRPNAPTPPPGMPGHPVSSDPRHGFGHPGVSNPRPGMPGHPGVSNPQPGMPGHPGTSNPRPGAPAYPPPPPGMPPGPGNPMATGGMNPNQTYARPQQPMRGPAQQESVLQQSWVIPAVLITIVILLLVLLLLALSN
ncbi:protein kinase domain-containing protein [Nocardiopsis halotolerans]|uniref:protein kinase domain-containing protein n=1 Tax=Nocardiopsis halotolerans TaxID=124252 RepID=UPI00034D21CB|nr:serine/threonine-protein kinase [Nocardiopsis halotolerans]